MRALNRDDLINTDDATVARGKKAIQNARGFKLDDVPSDYQTRAQAADFVQNLEASLIDRANRLDALVDIGRTCRSSSRGSATRPIGRFSARRRIMGRASPVPAIK
jgi:hypothetical protein